MLRKKVIIIVVLIIAAVSIVLAIMQISGFRDDIVANELEEETYIPYETGDYVAVNIFTAPAYIGEYEARVILSSYDEFRSYFEQFSSLGSFYQPILERYDSHFFDDMSLALVHARTPTMSSNTEKERARVQENVVVISYNILTIARR